MSLYGELRRRNVFRVAAAYVVMGWLFLQVSDIVLDFVSAPDWVGKAVIALLVLGFIPALAIAWVFEVTPDGVKRDDGTADVQGGVRGRRLNVLTIGAVVVLAIMFFWEKLAPRSDTVVESTPPASVPGGTVGANISSPEAAPVVPDQDIPQRSIAVLPFVNRSSETDTAYFVDGMHDDVLTQLARIGDLKVISRTSVLKYRDTTKNMRQIGEELGVATLMEGAVQRAGNRVRINAQLIDAETDEHLWAETFDRELTPENIFDIQSDIARAIANALAATLTDDEKAAAATRAPTQNLDAYDLYLQARAVEDYDTVNENWRAIELGKKAVELDPDFALAMGQVGRAYTNVFWFSSRDPAHLAEGREWIERALALAPDEPRLHLNMADHLYHGYLDYQGALASLDIAQRGLPNNVDVYKTRTWILRRSGDFEGAIEAMSKVIELDPRDIQAIGQHAATYLFMGHFDDSRRWADRVRGFPEVSTAQLAQANWNEFVSLGSADALRQLLDAQPDADLGVLNHLKVEVPLLERRYDDALAALSNFPTDPLVSQLAVWPHSYCRARIHWSRGELAKSREEALIAVAELDGIASTRPNDARPVAARALMQALAGNEQQSRTDARLATELYPIELDVPMAPIYIADGLRALAVFADSDEIADKLAGLLALRANTYYIDYLLLDPVFDRHRDHPAITALIDKYSRRGGRT